jgi:formylglycine-generating enzyme required for sulfatase activity
MLGNVAEWTLDMYDPNYFAKLAENPKGDFFIKRKTFRSYHTAKGGGFKSKLDELRPADRQAQIEDWNQRDPQIPRSKWWLTDGDYVGFRIIKPVLQPSNEEAEQFYRELLGEKK